MFTNTAYEAFYTYIGLQLHAASIEILTSQKFFLGLMVLIFGAVFLFTAIQFFSRSFPSVLMPRKSVPLSRFVKIIACLFIGISLLKVGSDTSVKNYKRISWHSNSYIETKLPDVEEKLGVSFIFDLSTRAADEVARYITFVIDELFKTQGPETEAPSYFYKALMFAGTTTIEDPKLRDKINFYTTECFERILPRISENGSPDKLDLFYNMNPAIDLDLQKIPVELEGIGLVSCLEVKTEVVSHLRSYAMKKSGKVFKYHKNEWDSVLDDPDLQKNLFASQALVNFYMDQDENRLGIHKRALSPGVAGKIFHYMNRLFSWDGILSLIGKRDLQGASLTAQRSQEFSDLLQRAPHLAGIAKMILIFIFPWLVFFLIAGRWKIFIAWYAIYISVLLWNPIWTLFYHIMTSIAMSTEAMAAFGKVSDGVSLYSSQLITSRMYHFYSIYAWIQILSGPLPTALLAAKIFPWIRDHEEGRAPEFIDESTSYAKKAAGMVK